MGTRRGGTSAGDRVFLLRQENERGIVASGRLTDGIIFEAPHYSDPHRTAWYSYITWDTVLPIADRLPFDELRSAVPGHPWNTIYASGQQLNPPAANQLEALWQTHVRDLRLPRAAVSAWDVEVGDHLTRKERMERFGGGSQGGIEPSAQTPNVFLYSDPSKGEAYGYNFDGWSDDGTVFMYTGEGQRGDQLMREGNLAILTHKRQQNALRLFVADGVVPGAGAKNHLYVGEFEVDPAQPYVVEDAPDVDGEPRTVFVFRLLPVGSTLERTEDRSDIGDAASSGSAELVDLEANESSEFETPGAPPTTATKREADLVDRYAAMLAKERHPVRRWRLRAPGELTSMLTDLYDATEQELYEAKGSANRASIRLALGQLLDYERHLPEPPKLKTVLVPHQPAKDLVSLLHRHGVGCVWETSKGEFKRADP
ncbi:MAG: hypothetical protein JWO98_173 [Frankiales bacterium]|nr:hypothetical protein [Frankiales bacterium]